MHDEDCRPEALTLDPDDWEGFRALAHEMLDDMIEQQRTVRTRPAWRSPPDVSRAALEEPCPLNGAPLGEVYAAFRDHVLPYPTGNQHPSFFGWVMGNGTPSAMLAEMLAAGMNPHLAGYDQAATIIEAQVIKWFAELLGFPANASGLLVSGGTMANMNALAVARAERGGFDVRRDGLSGSPQLTVYAGAETHNWIVKGAEFMGLGARAFRAVPVGSDHRIKVDVCSEMIRTDLNAGLKPFCIVGTAGTVNTGAVDNIAALRGLADEFGLWLHVDGAFGSLAALAPKARTLVAAQADADSIAFDLHKWGYLPYEIGCVLVRDAAAHQRTFAQQATYISPMQRGPARAGMPFADRGVQLSRGFRALKAWMLLKEVGATKLGALIQQNIDQAQYLAALVAADPALELMAPAPLNIVCFRYALEAMDNASLDALNAEILMRIQESGAALPSHTRIGGRFAIRVSITNHRTRMEDIDNLVALVLEHGRTIAEAQ